MELLFGDHSACSGGRENDREDCLYVPPILIWMKTRKHLFKDLGGYGDVFIHLWDGFVALTLYLRLWRADHTRCCLLSTTKSYMNCTYTVNQ
jgi:hypothetical protein